MRIPVLFALPFILFSCNDEIEKGTSLKSEFTFSFDTVLVDSNEEFIYLNDRLSNSDISTDGRYLFNWNRNNNTLEKIDLDNLNLVKKIVYEKEGPDGIGSFVFNYAATANNNSLFWSYEGKGIWDQNSKLLRAFPIDKILENTEFSKEVLLSKIALFPNQSDKILTLYRKWSGTDFYFLKFDFQDNSYEKIELPELNKLSDFQVDILYDGEWAGSFNAGATASICDDKLVLTMNSYNEAYIYDLTHDSLYFKSWNGPLVGNKQSFQSPKEVEGESQQHWEMVRAAEESINYGNFIWDNQNQRYFRFSTKKIFGEEKTDFGMYKALRAEVFLSVFDEDFNLTGETIIQEIKEKPTKSFVKDGKIWLFENINDELGFVIMSMN